MDYIDMPVLVPDDVRGIIFDYGGTLDSHGDHWSHIILEAYIAAGVEPGIEDFVRATSTESASSHSRGQSARLTPFWI